LVLNDGRYAELVGSLIISWPRNYNAEEVEAAMVGDRDAAKSDRA
jgi:hypothetical protein